MLTAEARWISMEEAGQILGVSAKTIRRRVADGTIRAQRFGPRLLRVDESSLRASGRIVGGGAA